MQQRAAYSPQHCRDLARRQQIVDIDDDLGPLQRECAAVILSRGLARRLGAGGGGHIEDKMWCNWGIDMRVGYVKQGIFNAKGSTSAGLSWNSTTRGRQVTVGKAVPARR